MEQKRLEKINKALDEIFGRFTNVRKIADSIIKRWIGYIDEEKKADNDKINEYLIDSLNDELICYADQWAIIQFYINPEDVLNGKGQNVYDDFMDDLIECISK